MTSTRLRVTVLVCLLLALPLLLSAGTKVRLGGVSVNAGYSRGFYPYCYYPGLWCDPFFEPWGFGYPYYPAFYTAPGPNLGNVKFQTPYKNADVYLNGAYAGTVAELKSSIWLEPGVYDLELRPPGHEPMQKRVYVLTGKTVKLKFDRGRP